MAFDIRQAYKMALASRLAYDASAAFPLGMFSSIQRSPCGCASVMREMDGTLTLACRGTADPRDWVLDFRCRLVEVPCWPGRVHMGFAERVATCGPG